MSVTGYVFGLYDAKIAVWNGVESYGTAQDVISVEMMDVSFDTVNGELHGDDDITDVHARQISVKLRLKFAFNDLAVWAILTGQSQVDSTTVSSSMVFTNTNRPYFAVAGRVDQTAGLGDAQIFIPKCKITGPMGFAAQYGQYVTPQLDAMGVREGNTYGMGKLILHTTATSLTIPPT